MSDNELNDLAAGFSATRNHAEEPATKLSHVDAQAFENMRNTLHELAFSILNSELEANRAVRRTLVKWLHADRETIKSPPSWFYDKCLRQSLGIFTSRQRNASGDFVQPESREPIGNWLSRSVRSLVVELTTGFSICAAVLHPAVIFQADQFLNEEDEPLRQPECKRSTTE